MWSHQHMVPGPSFLESLSAKCFKNIWHSTPIPPFVPKISGVKVPISTSNIRCWYFLFLSFSCSLNIVDVGLFWLHLELTCVTRTSKNAVTPRDQNLPAFISNLASGLVMAVLRSNRSLSSGWRCGSASTFLHTLLVSVVSRSRIPSYLWATNPPFLHKRAWPTVNLSHMHNG